MYAVIKSGGKQHRVTPGDVIEVERLKDASDQVTFEPIFVVDDDGTARATAGDLSGARVTGVIVGESKGPKVKVRKYHNKTGYRRRAGHRQRYTSIEISNIALGGSSTTTSTTTTTTKDQEVTDGA
ncbi:MAG: 50S ribosomal protein L21 [Actinobacteria bacterium]|nr:50S ribosomal protein L21 [Actinomycetota bacterium]